SSTQTGNVPPTPSLTYNPITGELTFSPNDGTAPQIFNLAVDTEEIVTTSALNVNGTNLPVGSTVQDVLNALTNAVNVIFTGPLFTVNAGTTITSTDNSLGEEPIGFGDILHFWSPDSTIEFNVTPGSAVVGEKLAQNGATVGQIMTWNGTSWVPQNLPAGADNWGTQVAQTDTTIDGDGTSGSPLTIAQQGATIGQAIVWNGSSWTPTTIPPPTAKSGTSIVNGDVVLGSQNGVSQPLLFDSNVELDNKELKFSTPSVPFLLDLKDNKIGVNTQVGALGNERELNVFGAINLVDQRNSTSVGYGVSNGATGTFGTYFGRQAGAGDSGLENLAIGYLAGQNIGGYQNVFMGVDAGSGSAGQYLVGIGDRTLQNNNNLYGTAVGARALYNTQGYGNSAFGVQCGYEYSGDFSVMVGHNSAIQSNGSSTVSIGNGAFRLGSGNNNISIGENSNRNVVGGYNISMGFDSGFFASLDNCVGIGNESLKTANARGTVALGYGSGFNMNGVNNCLVGYNSGLQSIGDNVLATGTIACSFNQGGSKIAYGYAACRYNYGEDVIAVGVDAMRSSKASQSVSVGSLSGTESVSNYNTYVGYEANERLVAQTTFTSIFSQTSGNPCTLDGATIASDFGLVNNGDRNTFIFNGPAGTIPYTVERVSSSKLSLLFHYLSTTVPSQVNIVGVPKTNPFSTAVGCQAQIDKKEQIALGRIQLEEVKWADKHRFNTTPPAQTAADEGKTWVFHNSTGQFEIDYVTTKVLKYQAGGSTSLGGASAVDVSTGVDTGYSNLSSSDLSDPNRYKVFINGILATNYLVGTVSIGNPSWGTYYSITGTTIQSSTPINSIMVEVL
ncbi:MAG: hypothetical protein ACRDBG_28785, partial [Waterburya sp.]